MVEPLLPNIPFSPGVMGQRFGQFFGAQTLLSNLTMGNGATITFVDTNGNITLVLPTAPGTVAMFAAAASPVGWLLCDGSSFATTGTYAALFAAIGYTWGGAGASFNVPDLRGKAPIGVGTGTGLTPRALGAYLGDENMQQHNHGNTTGESATHTHTVPTGTFGQISNYANETSGGLGGAGSVVGPSGRGTPATAVDSNGHVHGTAVAGSGVAGNMQPSVALTFIIKF